MPALAVIGLMYVTGAAAAIGWTITAGAVFFALLSDIMFVSSYLNYQRLKRRQRDFSIAENDHLVNTQSTSVKPI